MDILNLYKAFLSSTGVCTDTRKIEKGAIFFALKGDNFNGNTMVNEAFSKGALYAVVDEDRMYSQPQNVFVVKDVLACLQSLATHHRQALNIPIIALTGSNGKTTTKELIYAVLSEKYKVTATIGNLNNHIGVPLTLLSFTNATQIGIVEMGANHQKEIAFLCQIALPDYGYITNFGKAHLEGFGGVEGVIKGKSELYEYLQAHNKTVFVNNNDAIQVEKTVNSTKYTFGTTPESDLVVTAANANPMARVSTHSFDVQSQLIGVYNTTNIMAAMAIGLYFEVSHEAIKNGIEKYKPNNNRSQIVEKNQLKIILDAYNANPSSMILALQNLEQLPAAQKMAFVGDMFELGNRAFEEHQKIVNWAVQHTMRTVFVGPLFYQHKEQATENQIFFDNFDALASQITVIKPQEATVLIKGSRGMALERILELL